MPVSLNEHLLRPSPRLGSTVLFLAGGLPRTVDDAVAAAAFRGALDEAVQETLALAAAENSLEEGREPAAEDLQKSSEAYRLEHDLISAGETEQWLETRGLTTDDFSGWLYRRLCRDACSPTAETAGGVEIPDRLPDLLRVHLWLSGGMDDLSVQLSRRAAADLEISERAETLSTAAVMSRFLERHGLDRSTLPEWLDVLGRDDSWLADSVRMEAAYERLASAAVSAEARARQLASTQWSLARFEIETLEVDSEEVAREAVLCVRNDGSSLHDVAAEAGFRSERVEVWTDALDERLAPLLLSAAEGDVVGPIEHGAGFGVHQVLRKLNPTLTDPAVTQRIDRVLVDGFFGGLCKRHISEELVRNL